MKKRFNFWILSTILLVSVVVVSCKDDFSEEDALNAQQTMDLSVRAYEPFAEMGVEGASVTIFQDGEEVTKQTNAQGIAVFPDVKIGANIPVVVKKEGYTEVQSAVSMNSWSYRQSQHTATIFTFALDGNNIGIVRGKAEIETDLTNDKPEKVPAGTVVTAILDVNDLEDQFDGFNISLVTITSTVGDDGMYELKLPSTVNGVSYEIFWPTLQDVDQTMGIGGYEGEDDFPLGTLPAKTTVKALFSPNSNATEIPYVNPIYAVVSSTPTGDEAEPAVLWVTTSGEQVSNIGIIGDGGKGYPASKSGDDALAITIVSLNSKGTGAIAKAETDADGRIVSVYVEDGGEGYVDDEDDNINKTNEQDASIENNVTIRAGEVLILPINYGTGVSTKEHRDFDVND